MSTNYQCYSIANQAAVIAAYAQMHGLTIVCTYRDEGESGLKIKNRMGLTQLIEDVRSGHADFGHLLVYDVSRWGRFQDIDESAHYEFTCRQAGIKVAYCAEEFDNDGSLISSIVKNIKRVMAAEFSRELSAKVHAAASRMARLGFKMGGQVGYGLERFAIGENSIRKAILGPGEYKYLRTDRVRVRPGTPDESAVVRWIFEEFVQGKSQADIVRELNRRGISRKNGLRWNRNLMCGLLRNEAYIGNLVWNRCSQKLGAKKTRNQSDLWIRTEGCYEPTIDKDLFLRARKILDEYRVCISEEEMLARVRKVLMKKGSLSAEIIDATPGLPAISTYKKHFGTLRNVYRLIGYNKTRYWNDLEGHQRWTELSLRHGAQLRESLENAGKPATFDPSLGCLRIDDTMNVCFGLAKWRNHQGRRVRWTLRCRVRWPPGWIVAIRLGTNNEAVKDYLLLPSPSCGACWLWLSEANLKTHKIETFQTFEELARSLIHRTNRSTPSITQAKRQRSKAMRPRRRKARRSRARHR
jgi:DNA invertase Pin-like site-specific DNA recombinase